MKNFSRKITSMLKLKVFVIRRLLKSDKFIFIDFIQQNKNDGFTEGFYSAGFTHKQINETMNLAQKIHSDNMIDDVMISISNEAKELIKTK